MPRKTALLAAFNGLNVDIEQNLLSFQDLVKAENADIIEGGKLEKRRGTEFINSSSLNGKVVQFIEWPRNDGTVIRLGGLKPDSGSNNHLIRFNADQTTTSIYTGLSQKRIGYFFYNNVLYMVDGSKYTQWDGSGSVSEVQPTTTDAQGNPVTDADLTNIKKCTSAVRHPKSMRFFFAGDGTPNVYYTEQGMSNYGKLANVVVPTTGDGPAIGLAIFVDAVIAIYQRTFWVWRGIDPTEDAIWEKIPVTEGTLSPFTTENGINQFEWLGSGSGYWAMAPALIGAAMTINPNQSLLANLAENEFSKIVEAVKNKDLAASAFDTRKRLTYIAYCDDSALDYNNKILVRKTDTNAVTQYTGLKVYDILYATDGEVWLGTDNYAVKLSDIRRDAQFDGTYAPVNFAIRTPNSSFGEPFKYKWVHKLAVAFKNPYYEDYALQIKLYVDDIAVLDTTYIPTDTDGDVIRVIFTDFKNALGKTVSVEVTNDQIETETVIYGMELEYEVLRKYGGVL
jgi:hypothetical protein